MPDLPPPPPPPLSFAGVVADAWRRWSARSSARWSEHGSVRWSARAEVRVVAAALVLLCAVVVGWRLVAARGEHGAAPEVVLPRAAASDSRTSPESALAAAPDGTDPSAPAQGPVTVHAAGAVARPGVYRLPTGARVADLVDAAGGAAPDADVDALNLAALLEDGARVYVPRRGEEAPAAPDGAATGGGRSPPARPLDLNTATLAELEQLPGVGPATAQAIVDYRRRKGRFRSVDELLEVRGIGPSRLQSLRSKVRV